ncbi:MAG: hypothetical protein M1465_03295 [Candidatus Marsarchaeota archaeon]|nr:hypothetical protein [Candidatus Marsarchaeota archaeon]
MQNLSFRRNDRNCEAFAVHINTENVSFREQFGLVLGKISNNLKSRSKTISFAHPTAFYEIGISLPITVLFNGNSDPVSRINSKFNKIEGFGSEGFAVARNIEFDGNPSNLCFASPYGTFQAGINLNIETCPFLGISKSFSMKIHERIAEVPAFPESVIFGSRLQGKVFENFGFLASNVINLQKNSTLHITNQIYMFANIYYANYSKFIPPLKGVGFLPRFR